MIADLFREAGLAQADHRQAHQRDLDAAVVLLRDLAGLVREDAGAKMSHNAWRAIVHRQISGESIDGAIATVGAVVKPSTGKPYRELASRWRRARKLFFSITMRIDIAASPGGAAIAGAMAWLKDQPDWSRMAVSAAPKAVISKAWQPHVLNAQGEIKDARAYVFATIDAWRRAIKHRDIFARPGIRYADPRIGMLEGRDWQTSKGVVCILQVRDRPTTLAKALIQLGRLIKTLHVLNYIDDADFRRRILIQLNRQEFRHKLARKIYHGDRGEVRNALRQGQEDQLGALGLIPQRSYTLECNIHAGSHHETGSRWPNH